MSVFLCGCTGGPLCEGDIEEADGVLQVFCPWHDYDFDLRTGRSGTSLQASTQNYVLTGSQCPLVLSVLRVGTDK